MSYSKGHKIVSSVSSLALAMMDFEQVLNYDLTYDIYYSIIGVYP